MLLDRFRFEFNFKKYDFLKSFKKLIIIIISEPPVETAKIQCLNWEECQNIYQSEKHEPGIPGQPIFWARGPGQIGHSEGDVAWTLEGR